jgi:cell division protein FtsZ
MTLNLMIPSETEELRPRITVFGVGGAGGNAVNNMIAKRLQGVDFVVANTDAQALHQSDAPHKVQMGLRVTGGLGAGAKPAIGAAAAEESIEQIVEHLNGAHMCFITAGMGGGTGTGSAPIIAQAARELGVLTVGVVTKPFQFEGARRMRQAEEGIEALQKVVDTLIIIPNQNLFRIANEKTSFTDAFAMADDVLYQGVKGVTDLMVRPGLINLDFADVRAVMDEMGKAMMGTGEASGEDRAVHAAEKAIANPLLDEISLNGARGVLINITGGLDMKLFEIDEAAHIIREKVDADANIIVGTTLDPDMEGMIRVSVVATGIDIPQTRKVAPAAPTSGTTGSAPTRAPAPSHAPAAPPVAPAAMMPAPMPAAPQRAPAAVQMAEPARLATTEIIGADDVPPPAYAAARRPEPVEPAVRTPASPLAGDPGSFVPPRRPMGGAPTAEALRSLRESLAAARGEAAPAEAARGEPRRFGLGSLIDRMSGNPAAAAPAQPAAPRAEAPRTDAARPEAGRDADQDRVDIPAFLRRQAN